MLNLPIGGEAPDSLLVMAEHGIQNNSTGEDKASIVVRVLSKDKSRYGCLGSAARSALPTWPLEARLPSPAPRLLGTVKAAACHRLLQPFSSSTTSPPSWSSEDQPSWRRGGNVPRQPTILGFSLDRPGPGP
eukprot:NP_001274741.1 uncharacterized protein LOC101928093 [Homo sapiens]